MSWLFVYVLLAEVAASSLEIAFPFNSQVPPVARVGTPFTFEFSPSTFVPSVDGMIYTLSGAPAWLSLERSSRKLWGTPGASDVGSPAFNITAATSAGSATMQVTLIVAPSPGPSLGANISDQLAKAGSLNGPTSLSLYPSKPFDITFARSTFVGNGNNLSYYATLSDHTPLPSWVDFDAERLRFSGTAPLLSASPQSFEILLIASDYVGFAATWTSFTLVVSSIQLVFSPWEQTGSGLFVGNIGTLDAVVGEDFNYAIERSILAEPDLSIVIDLGSAANWLHFDAKTFRISGHVLSNVQPGIITASAVVSYPASSTSETQVFQINVQPAQSSRPTPTALASRTSPSNVSTLGPSTGVTQEIGTSGRSVSKSLKIILPVVLGLILAVVALIALILYCRRRRAREQQRGILKPDISRPVIHVEEWQDDGQRASHDVEKGSDEGTRTPDRAPQVALNFSPKKPIVQSKYRQSGQTVIGENEAAILADFNRSSWGYTAHALPSHNPHDSMKIPTEMAWRSRLSNLSPTKHRPPRASYPMQPRSLVGHPRDRRLTGMGHGRRTYTSLSRGAGGSISVLRPRDCNSYSSCSTQSTSMLSATASAFPAPPAQKGGVPLLAIIDDADGQESVHPTGGVSDISGEGGGGGAGHRGPIDRRSLQEKRQSYIRHRAANRSPFFGATGPSSRTSSQSRSRNTAMLGTGYSSAMTGTNTSASATATTRTNSSTTGTADLPPSASVRSPNRSHRTTYSASSSLEPPLRIVKRRDQMQHQQLRNRLAAGFPRPVSASLGRGLRDSVHSTARSSRVFASADEESSSFYSQSSSAGSSAESLSSSSGEEGARVGQARDSSFVLPDGMMSHNGQASNGDAPLAEIEEVESAIARSGRLSQARRSGFGVGRGGKAYAAGAGGSIMDRPRPRSDMKWRGESGNYGSGRGRMSMARAGSRGRTPLSMISNGSGQVSGRASGSVNGKGGRIGSGAWGSFRGNEAFL